MAIFKYDEELKKVIPIESIPISVDNIRNYVNMRTTWSGQTKIEFSTTTIEESAKKMNGGG